MSLLAEKEAKFPCPHCGEPIDIKFKLEKMSIALLVKDTKKFKGIRKGIPLFRPDPKV